MSDTTSNTPEFSFETNPAQYKHIKLEVEGPVARLLLDIQEDQGLREGYELKLNSYDLSVDIELADALQRLRFEHPEVSCVIVGSAQEGVFSAGANIFMLGKSSHAFKVNFCKFTNETRFGIEDSSENSGQKFIAALAGVCSGGGYELALACDEIYLVDDRKSAVSLPEVPYLGVLPGTGGLTRVVDKRKVRRDLADVFCTLAEGVKGKRAVKWNFVDAVWPLSSFDDKIAARAAEIAGEGHPERKGVRLGALDPKFSDEGIEYQHVKLSFGPVERAATLEITVPDELPDLPAEASSLGADWFGLRMWRELDDALLQLRFHYPEVGLVLLKSRGSVDNVLKLDAQIAENRSDWFVDAVAHFIKRTLKRVDMTAKSFFTLIDEGSCFAGSFFELALAGDRSYMLEDEAVEIGLSALNAGPFPMGNGLTRLETRFLSNPDHAKELMEKRGKLPGEDADELGLVTVCVDDIDWDDEVRLAIEERVSLSPDSLTGLEANLRYAGPETMETKVFGRLTAWQNWIFQRPNAVGERGALSLYGQPASPSFDWRRT